jgi:Carboxypeptidase regulatory-like domain
MPQVNPTTNAPSGPRTGLIVGQVVDSTGTPVPEAVVQLTMPKYPADLPTTPKGRVMADSEGRYFFADLPAGEYRLFATKEGYTGGTYGQRRASGGSQLFSLGEAERRTDAKLPLWKYAVIGGTVADEAGEPAIGVTVQALAKDVVAGRARYGTVVSAPYAVPTTTTDDRGMFRLSQLTPGSYVVVVPSAQATVPVTILNTFAKDQTLLNEVFNAVQPNGSNNVGEVRSALPIGQPRTQQAGDVALVTMSSVLIPAFAPGGATAGQAAPIGALADKPVSSVDHLAVYRTTYFPAAATAAAATVIALEGGEERTNLTIGLRPTPAVRLSGRLVTPDGSAPPPMALRLVGEAANDVGDAGFEVVSGVSDATGRFTLMGVPPGEYVLKHAGRIPTFAIQQGQPAFWLSERLTVGSSDVPDLTVPVRPALRVEGRIEFRGAPGKPVPPIIFNAGAIFETAFGDSGQFALQGVNRETGAFFTFAAGGQYIMRAIESAGWFLKSVTVDGKDVTDKVFDLQTGARLVIVYTDQHSKVSGTVRDARGAVSATADVLAFPVDPQRWSGFGSTPRFIKSTPASGTGAYAFENLPAGDYYLIAVNSAEADGWTDPTILEGLSRQATRLTVVENQATTLDLTLKPIR